MTGRMVAVVAAIGIGIAAGLPAVAQTPDLATAFAGSLAPLPDAGALTQRGVVYVPAYSAIRAGRGKTRIELAATLSVHNVSDAGVLVIEGIDYFDTAGTLVERPLDKPVALRPFGTIEAFVPAGDARGGSGANFVVRWAAAGAVPEPAVEAVMIGTVGNTSYSFVSPGRPLRPGKAP